MSAPFLAGWHRVRERDGSAALMWVAPYPLPGSPSAWVIAGRTREACARVSTCAFVARRDDFELATLISRIDAPAVLDPCGSLGSSAQGAESCVYRNTDPDSERGVVEQSLADGSADADPDCDPECHGPHAWRTHAARAWR